MSSLPLAAVLAPVRGRDQTASNLPVGHGRHGDLRRTVNRRGRPAVLLINGAEATNAFGERAEVRDLTTKEPDIEGVVRRIYLAQRT